MAKSDPILKRSRTVADLRQKVPCRGLGDLLTEHYGTATRRAAQLSVHRPRQTRHCCPTFDHVHQLSD